MANITFSQPRAKLWIFLPVILAFLTLLVGEGTALAAEATSRFDHDLTGFLLNGAHQRVDCESCHQRGIFKGTPMRCEGCHRSASSVATTKKPPNHIQSEDTCDDCHTEISWAGARMDHFAITGSCITCHNGSQSKGKPVNHIQSHNQCGDCHRTISWVPARFDHGSVTGTCFSCHNGSTATGKTPSHVPSSNNCEDCHRTTAWVPAGFDHSSVTGSCFTCHNGTRATGKPNNHIASDNQCENCHRTTAWVPATGFDHSSVTGACFSCHNGSTATGKPPTHVPSSNACEDCHRTNGWVPATFDHDSVTGSCSSCHNGTTATGKTPGHFGTSLQCDQCHNNNSWQPVVYSHTSAAYPGDHRSRVGCTDCHTANNTTVLWPNAAYQPDCAGCHAGDFKQDAHKKVDGPTIFYTVSELRDCSGSCHRYTDSTLTTIERTRSNEHSPSRGEW